MVTLASIYSLLLALQVKDGLSYFDYQDYTREDYIDGTDGTSRRIVGGSRAPVTDYQSVGALVFKEVKKTTRRRPTSKCTVTLVSPWFALTATHCFYFENELDGGNCAGKGVEVKDVKSKKHNTRVSCERLKEGDVKMWPISPPASVIFGASDINNKTDLNKSKIIEIDYFLRPYDSYDNRKNEGYGERGGQDILLIKLKEPLTDLAPACLPGPNYSDIRKSTVVGFGNYYRRNCQTGPRGPMKYHNCQMGSEEELKKCKNTNIRDFFLNRRVTKDCEVKFKMNGDRFVHGCQKEIKTPSHFSNLCLRFLNISKFNFDDDDDDGIDEVHLFQHSATDPTESWFLGTCYRTDPGLHGWCHTQGNHYSRFPSMNKTEQEPIYNWGFCTKECLDTGEELNGVMRSVEDVDVMDEGYCDEFLDSISVNKSGKFQYRPQVVCVGRNQSFKYKAFYTREPPESTNKWGKYSKSYLKRNPGMIGAIYKQFDEKHTGYYVHSAGLCHGDSGGPLLQYAERWVVTGLVSGGRDHRVGDCGGINNPTLYARVKALTGWILKHIGDKEKEDICIVDDM